MQARVTSDDAFLKAEETLEKAASYNPNQSMITFDQLIKLAAEYRALGDVLTWREEKDKEKKD